MRFTVLGEPKGKGRPRFARAGSHVRTYTPEATAAYENLILLEWRRQCGEERYMDGESLAVRGKAYFSVPKSASRRKAAEMLAGDLRPKRKPDVDNITKAVLDALNGAAWRDDAQIADCRMEKFYGSNPRLEIEITELGADEGTNVKATDAV